MLIIKSPREAFATPVQVVSGIVGKQRQTLPILSNILISKVGTRVDFTATDLDIEIKTFADIGAEGPDISVTVDAAKLQSLISALNHGSEVTLSQPSQSDPTVELKQGKSTFKLNTLPADEFPNRPVTEFSQTLTIPANQLRHLLQLVHFSMAQQDIRYFLNGMLLSVQGDVIRVVTTDGHRLAYCEGKLETPLSENTTDGHRLAYCEGKLETPLSENIQCIVPRRTVMEMLRLIPDTEEAINIAVSTAEIRITWGNITLSSKLVEGKFPDYNRVIPVNNTNIFVIKRDVLLGALKRTAILANAKLRGVKWELKNNALTIQSTNSDQEEAKDVLDIDYNGIDIEIGFNLLYLQDVLNNLRSEEVQFALHNNTGAMLITMPDNSSFKYVVMPMRT